MNRTTLGIIIAIIVLVIIGFITFSVPGGERVEQRMEEQRATKAPDFNLQDYEGNTVELSDFSGKPLVINSWAAWCPFCKKELEDFAKVQGEFKDQVVIIAIDRAESLETAKRFTDEAGITDDLIFLLDPGDSFYQSIGGFSMPETIFVDKNGVTRFHKRGPMDSNEMRERIKEIL